MIWHAFNIRLGLSRRYQKLPKDIRCDHHTLLLACGQEENGGRVEGAGEWDDRDWIRFAGLTLAEVEAVVGAGLAEWVKPGEGGAHLDPRSSETDDLPHPGLRSFDRSIGAFENRSDAIRSDRSDPTDRSIDRSDAIQQNRSDAIRNDRSGDRKVIDRPLDLVVLLYDIKGEEMSQRESEAGSEGAKRRWDNEKKRKQAESQGTLPGLTPGDRSVRSLPITSDQSPPPTGVPIGVPNAQHSTATADPDPPLTPPFGRGLDGSVPIRNARTREAPPEDVALFESFWAWLLRNRAKSLIPANWAHAPDRAFEVARRVAANDPRGRFHSPLRPAVPLAELFEATKRDLAVKFRDDGWIERTNAANHSIRTYWRDGYDLGWLPEWRRMKAGGRAALAVVPAEPPPVAAPDPANQREAVASDWASTFPGEPMPGDLAEAQKRLFDHHRRQHGFR